jgi:DNA replication protein DnaC
MKTPIQNFAEKYGRTLLKHSICPECGDQMYYWKHQEVMGQPPTPTCPNCGYKDLLKREELLVKERSRKALQQDAVDAMKKNSIVTDQKAWQYTFDNFNVYDDETRNAKELALIWAKNILEGNNLHAILTGRPGVGKTHLGCSIAQKVLVDSNYTKRISIISYRELLEQLKIGFNDPEIYKSLQISIIGDLKKCDLVIIDDLGAELGKIDAPSQPTNFNLDTLTSLVEARMNKPTIFTSNLNSSQILTLYGERIYSRIMNGAVEGNGINAFRFKATEDKRRNPSMEANG